ncbi:hypothetical protein M3Y97_00466100 [Aphelenchoides bicaudatus]|nr:hypothetical protein M3Y97_00466100 [Aphelenchoides bicaudatus]
MSATVLKTTKRLLDSSRPLIFGMVHVSALPGAPLNKLNIDEISKQVCKETRQYVKAKVDGIIYENMHDLPYQLKHGPETTAFMSRLCRDAVNSLNSSERDDLLLGIQILAAANKEALSSLTLFAPESFVFAHVADEGLMNACAGPLIRYRQQINAENVAILTDIKKKHSSHAITSDISIGECAHAAEFFLADGLIVTGTATGSPAQVEDLNAVQHTINLPVLIGSGIDRKNFKKFFNAHGFIVGSYFKKGGHWKNELDEMKISNFVSLVRGQRRNHNLILLF